MLFRSTYLAGDIYGYTGNIIRLAEGEFIEFDFNLTATSLAGKLGVSRQTVNELLLERRSVSPVMALRLSKLFGNTPEFWLNAQRAVDLWKAQKEKKREIDRIRPLHAA